MSKRLPIGEGATRTLPQMVHDTRAQQSSTSPIESIRAATVDHFEDTQ